jgi:hypothetical protein
MGKRRKIIPARAIRVTAAAPLLDRDRELVQVSDLFLQDRSEKCREILEKFRNKIEQYTWLQVKGSGKGFNIETRHPPPRKWPNTVSPDEVCIRLKASGKARVFGFRDGTVLYVVWVDPDHRIDGG